MEITRYGQYEVTGEIGHGGMGVVYRARNERTGLEVALKVLPAFLAKDEKFRSRFDREIETLMRLRHPKIVNLLNSGIEGEIPYYAMELLNGEPLSKRLPRGPLPEAEAVAIVGAVLEGLEYAHMAGGGAIHRDLKPDNIILTDTGVRIIDYGLSKMLAEATLTVTGSTFGTPAFMAPEQFLDTRMVDHRADLWGAAMVLYASLAGRTPFSEDSAVAILRKLNTPDFVMPPIRSARPEVSEATEAVLSKALQKQPRDRYQTAREFRDALAGLPYAPAVTDYSPAGDFPPTTWLRHPIFKEQGLVTGCGESDSGISFIKVEFPAKGMLELACRRQAS